MKKHFITTTRTQLIAGMVVSILIPALFINLFYFRRMNEYTKKQIKNYNEEIVRQTGEKVEALISQVNITTRQLIATSISSDAFKNYEEKTPREKLDTVRKYQKVLRDISISVSYKAGIYLVGSDNRVYTGMTALNSEKLLNTMENKEYAVPYQADYYTALNSIRVIPFTTTIKQYNGYDSLKAVGIELYYSDLDDILKDVYMGEDAEFFIINEQNQLIYFTGESMLEWEKNIGKTLNREQEEYLNKSLVNNRTDKIIYPIKGTGWKLIACPGDSNIAVQSQALGRVFIIIIFISLVFSLCFAYMISWEITKPINSLIQKMKHVGEEQVTTIPVATRNRDIVILSNSFDDMLRQIDSLMKIMVEKEKEKAVIQLKALQAQINPHFLYNTLEVMRSIALENNVPAVGEISKALAKMFRYSISKNEEFVTVEEEINHVKNYSMIQKYRYGEKIQFFYAVDKSILREKMAKFILQPIVENSIHHGLEPKVEKGAITVIGKKQGEFLEFRVLDSGKGMTDTMLEQIKKELEKGEENSMGIGLSNIDMRIKLYYGSTYGVHIDSRENEGTQVTIKIPVSKER